MLIYSIHTQLFTGSAVAMSEASDSQNMSEEQLNLSEGTSPSGSYDEGSRSPPNNLPKAATRQRKKRIMTMKMKTLWLRRKWPPIKRCSRKSMLPLPQNLDYRRKLHLGELQCPRPEPQFKKPCSLPLSPGRKKLLVERRGKKRSGRQLPKWLAYHPWWMRKKKNRRKSLLHLLPRHRSWWHMLSRLGLLLQSPSLIPNLLHPSPQLQLKHPSQLHQRDPQEISQL